MTYPSAGAGLVPPGASPAASYATATGNLRAAARWLLTTAAASGGVLMAGATGLVGAGGRAVAVNVTRVHFEGYAVVIAVMLVAQGLLTLWTLYARRRHVLGRTAPIW